MRDAAARRGASALALLLYMSADAITLSLRCRHAVHYAASISPLR